MYNMLNIINFYNKGMLNMTSEFLRFNEIVNEMSFGDLDLSNMLEKYDKNILRGELDFILERQGFDYTSSDIVDSYSIYKLNEMIKKNIDLADMDRWNSVEIILGREINFKDAMYIANILWEENIEILELV